MNRTETRRGPVVRTVTHYPAGMKSGNDLVHVFEANLDTLAYRGAAVEVTPEFMEDAAVDPLAFIEKTTLGQ